ncbi:hypothetical protein HPT25_05790 [Bacillus sp. BRMEA1]|nr:hypothetical protein [Neobacillus endophyticus]NRD77006.1 hypothetical protein [Neobacillus endophyticus]
MEKNRVIFEGEEYIILHEYSSGFLEIMKAGSPYRDIKLVHFSELSSK